MMLQLRRPADDGLSDPASVDGDVERLCEDVVDAHGVAVNGGGPLVGHVGNLVDGLHHPGRAGDPADCASLSMG